MSQGNGKGKQFTQDEHKLLANLTLQNDERIEQLLDLVIELKVAAAKVGWRLNDEKEWQASAQARAQASDIVKMQRARLRKSLGLD